jgi:hypothetical protein
MTQQSDRLVPGWNGRYFEDFTEGDVYRHPLGRTITTTDNAWLTLLTQNTGSRALRCPLRGTDELGQAVGGLYTDPGAGYRPIRHRRESARVRQPGLGRSSSPVSEAELIACVVRSSYRWTGGWEVTTIDNDGKSDG